MFSVFTNDRSAKLELGRQLCKNATEIWIGYYHACVLQHRGVNWVLYCDSWHWNGKVIFNHEKFKTLKRSPIVRINSWEGLEVIATSVNPHKITKSFFWKTWLLIHWLLNLTMPIIHLPWMIKIFLQIVFISTLFTKGSTNP